MRGSRLEQHRRERRLREHDRHGRDRNPPLRNEQDGVLVRYSTGLTVVGGGAAGAGNLVAANGNHGIHVAVVCGNTVGTDRTGTLPLGNAGDGIVLNQSSNTLVAGNLSSANTRRGAYVLGGSDNTSTGNRLGTDRDGLHALGNAIHGIQMEGSPGNRVGTDGDGVGDAAEANLISGNRAFGVAVTLPTSVGNVIAGNYVGTDATGTRPLGNLQHGVADAGVPTLIGGAAVAGNLISANGMIGVFLSGATDAAVRGNTIGIDLTGGFDLGNTHDGATLIGATGAVVSGNLISLGI